MPVAKLLASSTPDTMNVEGENNCLDTYLKQAVGKEPFFSLSRTKDRPVQWIKRLHDLDQRGCPVLPHAKVQMQKCDKCGREFCSTINYRRHIRVHRRSFNVDKEFHTNRELLGNFWNKLTLDEAMEIISFKDVMLGEVPGSSITREISSNLLKSGFSALPQVYVMAGSILVDIIQGRPSILPISSQDLFSILDDASERTFLCAGTAESVQKYVFDGDDVQIGLETTNLIACTSFLVEQRLVKAWLAHKEAEALRCHKLLVEEEEAAQKRQAVLLEKKRQKKLRQKEQRAKDQSNGEKADLSSRTDIFESTPYTGTSGPPASVEADSNALESTRNHVHVSIEFVELSNNAEDRGTEAQGGCISDHLDSGTCEQSDLDTTQNVDPKNVSGNDYKHSDSGTCEQSDWSTSQNVEPQIVSGNDYKHSDSDTCEQSVSGTCQNVEPKNVSGNDYKHSDSGTCEQSDWSTSQNVEPQIVSGNDYKHSDSDTCEQSVSGTWQNVEPKNVSGNDYKHSDSGTCEQSDWSTFQNVEPQIVSGNDYKHSDSDTCEQSVSGTCQNVEPKNVSGNDYKHSDSGTCEQSYWGTSQNAKPQIVSGNDYKHSDSDTCEQSVSGTSQNVEPQNLSRNVNKHSVVTRLQKGGGNVIHSSHTNVHMLKRDTVQKYGPHRDHQRAGPISSSKVWTKKPISDTGGELMRNRVQNDATNQTDQANCQLMIGSISVPVTTSTAQQQVSRAEVHDSNSMELKKSSVEAGRLWRQKHEIRGQSANRSCRQVSEDDASDKGADRTMPSESCLQSGEVDGIDSEGMDDSHMLVDIGEQPEVLPYSYEVAIAFHAKRWKEAFSGEHEIINLSSDPESPCGSDDATNDDSRASDSQQHSIPGSSAENQSDNAVGVDNVVGVVRLSPNGNGKSKI